MEGDQADGRLRLKPVEAPAGLFGANRPEAAAKLTNEAKQHYRIDTVSFNPSNLVGKYHIYKIKNKYPIPGAAVVDDFARRRLPVYAHELEERLGRRQDVRDAQMAITTAAAERALDHRVKSKADKLLEQLEDVLEQQEVAAEQNALDSRAIAADKANAKVFKLIREKKVLEVEREFDRGNVNVNSVEEGLETTGLMMAAATGLLTVVRLYLRYGADPNRRRKTGDTALHYAWQNWQSTPKKSPKRAFAYRVTVDIIKVLLQFQSNPSLQSFSGTAPLHLAAQYGHDEIALLLLKAGASTTARNQRGLTPLQVAESQVRNGQEHCRTVAGLLRNWHSIKQVHKESAFKAAWNRAIQDATSTERAAVAKAGRDGKQRGQTAADVPAPAKMGTGGVDGRPSAAARAAASQKFFGSGVDARRLLAALDLEEEARARNPTKSVQSEVYRPDYHEVAPEAMGGGGVSSDDEDGAVGGAARGRATDPSHGNHINMPAYGGGLPPRAAAAAGSRPGTRATALSMQRRPMSRGGLTKPLLLDEGPAGEAKLEGRGMDEGGLPEGLRVGENGKLTDELGAQQGRDRHAKLTLRSRWDKRQVVLSPGQATKKEMAQRQRLLANGHGSTEERMASVSGAMAQDAVASYRAEQEAAQQRQDEARQERRRDLARQRGEPLPEAERPDTRIAIPEDATPEERARLEAQASAQRGVDAVRAMRARRLAAGRAVAGDANFRDAVNIMRFGEGVFVRRPALDSMTLRPSRLRVDRRRGIKGQALRGAYAPGHRHRAEGEHDEGSSKALASSAPGMAGGSHGAAAAAAGEAAAAAAAAVAGIEDGVAMEEDSVVVQPSLRGAGDDKAAGDGVGGLLGMGGDNEHLPARIGLSKEDADAKLLPPVHKMSMAPREVLPRAGTLANQKDASLRSANRRLKQQARLDMMRARRQAQMQMAQAQVRTGMAAARRRREQQAAAGQEVDPADAERVVPAEFAGRRPPSQFVEAKRRARAGVFNVPSKTAPGLTPQESSLISSIKDAPILTGEGNEDGGAGVARPHTRDRRLAKYNWLLDAGVPNSGIQEVMANSGHGRSPDRGLADRFGGLHAPGTLNTGQSLMELSRFDQLSAQPGVGIVSAAQAETQMDLEMKAMRRQQRRAKQEHDAALRESVKTGHSGATLEFASAHVSNRAKQRDARRRGDAYEVPRKASARAPYSRFEDPEEPWKHAVYDPHAPLGPGTAAAET